MQTKGKVLSTYCQNCIKYWPVTVLIFQTQSSSGVMAGCPRVSPTWSSLSQLLSLIQPHLPPPFSLPVVRLLLPLHRLWQRLQLSNKLHEPHNLFSFMLDILLGQCDKPPADGVVRMRKIGEYGEIRPFPNPFASPIKIESDCDIILQPFSSRRKGRSIIL